VKSWSEKKVSFQPDASPDVVVDIPVERLREVWKGTPPLVAQARAMKVQPGAEDVAFIEKDNQVHNVKGLVVGIEGDSLVFRFNDADRKIAVNRLVGILFAGTKAANDDTFHQAVELMTGDVISGQWKTAANGNLGLETPWGKTLNVPLDTIANIQCRNGKLVYLSDVTPAHVEQVPYFDRVFSYRNDASLSGGALKLLDGYYDKGVAVHSRCLLEYDVAGKFEQFKAHVGFQQPDGLSGQCVIRVLADGKVAYEDLNARGDQKPVDVSVSVSGTSKLTLEVDFGQGQDVGDRVVWANARLVRAAVQK
ncbi:MAG: NPCBM/NEW2 domain-containing protein, partial [Tepidisphaerales bacterium]